MSTTKQRRQFKVCTKCHTRRAVSRFDADASRPDGLYCHCKDCKHTPGRRKQINAVRADAQRDAKRHADRSGRPWTENDDKIVLELPFRDAAKRLKRGYWAVAQRRFRLKHGKVKK
ncbi:MAG: hypothetical protein IT435_02595 [Phycisphaerales bacterium]|nr:hypothetical protein [Phycisphaerales bacterium]